MTKTEIALDDWQIQALQPHRRLLLCTGRQVGKTTIMARKAAERMVSDPGSKIIIVSLTEDQAQLIIVMILDYLERNHRKLIRKGKYKPTKGRIQLSNGSQVIARPVGTTGNAVRGFTGSVLIVDEASRMPESVWTAAKPTLLTTAGEIWMCSTPFGKQGYFWESFLNKHGTWKVIHISSEEVIKTRKISESWTKEQREGALEHLAEAKANMTELRYGQEYLGLFLDDLTQFFPDSLIRSCMRPRSEVAPLTSSGKNYLGVDVARMGKDETVLFSLTRRKKKLYQLDREIYTKILITETTRNIIHAHGVYTYAKILVDDAGVGGGVFDALLEHPKTRRRVVAINNASRSLDNEEKRTKKLLKEDLYNNLRNLMERGDIVLWKDDKTFQSLKSIQVEFKEGRMRIYGRYSHITEALVRAAWCVKDKHLNIWLDYY